MNLIFSLWGSSHAVRQWVEVSDEHAIVIVVRLDMPQQGATCCSSGQNKKSMVTSRQTSSCHTRTHNCVGHDTGGGGEEEKGRRK